MIKRQYYKDYIEQHTPSSISRWLDGVFTYSQVRYGNIKNKEEGDIVIINLCANDDVSIFEYLSHTHDIKEIKSSGIYTNVFFNSDFYSKLLKHINSTL
jgi:hypothetical protein